MKHFKNYFVYPRKLSVPAFQLLLVLLLFALIGCNPLGERIDEKSPNFFYNRSKTDVYYSPSGDWFMEGDKLLNADMESFEVLGELMARDKDRIYFNGYPIATKTIDLKSFFMKPIPTLFDIGFDKNEVYAFVSEYDSIHESWIVIAKIIKGANPETFTKLDFNWSKDDENYFFNYERIPVDYATFENLNETFVKDSSQVLARFNKSFRAIDADPSTFVPLDTFNGGRDAKNVYWVATHYLEKPELHVIPYSDASEIFQFNDTYFRVADKVYFDGKLIEGADARTFVATNIYYAKDSTASYRMDKVETKTD